MLSNRGNGCKILCSPRRLEASATVRVPRAGELSTHVLTPRYIGVLWEVARDNTLLSLFVKLEIKFDPIGRFRYNIMSTVA